MPSVKRLCKALKISHPLEHPTCIGYGKKKPTCGLLAAGPARQQAVHVLEEIANNFEDEEVVSDLLDDLAHLLLCKRWHQRQADDKVSQWESYMDDYRAEREERAAEQARQRRRASRRAAEERDARASRRERESSSRRARSRSTDTQRDEERNATSSRRERAGAIRSSDLQPQQRQPLPVPSASASAATSTLSLVSSTNSASLTLPTSSTSSTISITAGGSTFSITASLSPAAISSSSSTIIPPSSLTISISSPNPTLSLAPAEESGHVSELEEEHHTLSNEISPRLETPSTLETPSVDEVTATSPSIDQSGLSIDTLQTPDPSVTAATPSPTEETDTSPPVDLAESTSTSPARHSYSECAICIQAYSDNDENNIWECGECNNRIHADCFETWRASQVGSSRSRRATCIYCRAPVSD